MSFVDITLHLWCPLLSISPLAYPHHNIYYTIFVHPGWRPSVICIMMRPPFFAPPHFIYDVSRNHSLKQRVAASIDWPSRQYYGLGGGGGRVFQASGATYYFDEPDVQAAMAAADRGTSSRRRSSLTTTCETVCCFSTALPTSSTCKTLAGAHGGGHFAASVFDCSSTKMTKLSKSSSRHNVFGEVYN